MNAKLASDIASCLPYLRRYMRALSGSQQRGDDDVAKMFEALLDGTAQIDRALPLRIGLFQVMYRVAAAQLVQRGPPDDGASIADLRLARLPAENRAALLLYVVEEFVPDEIAQIMQLPVATVIGLIKAARRSLAKDVAGHILIIEDEALIAMDLATIVTAQGHSVTGIAKTHASAVDIGLAQTPDLILADICLADQSSGVDAVYDLIDQTGDIPVIFITGYPEALLTGQGREPAFLITKPYLQDQVQSAVSQAMFFRSTAQIAPLASV